MMLLAMGILPAVTALLTLLHLKYTCKSAL